MSLFLVQRQGCLHWQQPDCKDWALISRQNGVKVKHVLPYHPALIGAEELSEHMAKLALTKPLLDAKTSTVFLTLTVRDLPTDSCCPKEKAKPSAVSQERNS